MTWFYQSKFGSEIDSYVSLNVEEGIWTYGSLSRSAWLDISPTTAPIAAHPDGRLFNHEVGGSDGETDPPGKIDSFIESAPFELSAEGAYDKGDRFMFISRILPDMTFRGFDNEVSTPQITMTLKGMDKPGGGYNDTATGNTIRTAIVPVEEFTEENHIRIRARAMAVRIETASRGTLWRMGVPRVYVRTDGQR